MKHSSKKALSGFIAMSMAMSIAAPAELISLSDVLTVKAAGQVGQKFTVGNGQTQHKDDNVDGYSYEIWLDNTGGSGSMTLGSGGTFSTEWSASVSRGNFLARRGRNYDATKKATEYGPIVMDYAADYTASSQGNSRLCVYGWMKNPLVEYYIIEDWVNWCPSPNGASKTVTIDGAEYEIFQLDHTGPTILGTNETFKQYFSVRKSKRTSGTITVSDHFKAWADAGWNIGNLTEVALNVEGWESSGSANVTKLTIGETGSGNSSSTNTNASQGQSQDNPWSQSDPVQSQDNPWGGQMPWGQTDPSQGQDNPWGGQMPWGQTDPSQGQDNPWGGQMPWGQTDPTQGQDNPWGGQMPWGQTDPTQGQDPGQTQTPTTGGSSFTASSSLSDIQKTAKAEFTATVPSEATASNTGKMTKIKYQSKKAGRQKPANVWLPEGYTEGKKYPVLYVNHGVMGGEDDMTKGWGITEMASYFIKKGQVQPFIIVFTQMYTGPNERPAGITQQDMDYYDDFLYDLTESLMPYMSEHYSVAEGRENTAICGFSMGGRESLYIGMKACDKIGYVAASSPAPGIVPAVDSFLNHRGSMTESEFKFATTPYLLMIGGGTNDTVVGTFPKQYHELYDKNGVDNIWFEKAGAGHDASVGTPLFYNFIGHIFPVASAGASQPTAQTPATQQPAQTQQPQNQPTQQSQGTTGGSAVSFTFGDLNDDTKIDITDLSLLAVHLIDKTKFTDKQTMAADVAYNGKIELADLATLRQFISKVITKLGDGYTAPVVNQPVASPSPSQQNTQTAPVQEQDNPWGQMPWAQTDPTQSQGQDNPWGQMPWGQTDPTQSQGQDNPWGQMPWGQTDPTQSQGQDNPWGQTNPVQNVDTQIPVQTASSTGSKGKVVNGVWESDADVSWIDPNKPMVAISFDDGPIGGSQNPSRIHNALTKNGFHATFFYWGERIAGNEQEIKNAFNAGFEVANHTWTHPYLTQQGDKGKSEVQKTKQALDAIIGGDNDYLLRPPYLSFDASVGQAVGVPCPNCGLDTQDWNGASKDQIVNTLKSALANGSLRNKVVLCHENYDSTAGAMEEFLPYLKSQGWQCVTVSEMFKAQGKTMQAGQLYNECK